MTAREYQNWFDLLYLPLGMYALRIVDNVEVSEDMVQEAFLQTWERISAGEEIADIKAWLYRCVHNAGIDWRRKRKEENMSEIPAEYMELTEEAIDTSERDAKIWQAIDKLPAKCREIFLMSKRDGMSCAEIAEELHLSEQTVKNQISKALGRLRAPLSRSVRPFFLPFL